MISGVVESCENDLSLLKERFLEIQKDTWADCKRLCVRCMQFEGYVSTVKNDAAAHSEIAMKRAIEVQNVLRSIEQFISNHIFRLSFKGLSEFSSRKLYMADVARFNLQINKLIEDLDIMTSKDRDSVRNEDFTVSARKIFVRNL